MAQYGRYIELESRALSMLGRYPNFGFAWKLLGESLYMQGKDALQALHKAAELLPDDADALTNYGIILVDLGKLEEAVVVCRRALEINPGYARAHNNLGNALLDLGRFEEAAACFSRALEINPNYAKAHNNLGNALDKLGRLDDAVASYRRALQQNPNYAVAHYNLGVTLGDLGRPETAAESYRRAIEIDPAYTLAHFNLGITLEHLGRLETAVESYRRAIEIDPAYTLGYLSLGNALRDLGNLEGAEAAYRNALKVDPKFVCAYSNLLYLHAFTRNIPPEQELYMATRWEKIALTEAERNSARDRAFMIDDSLVRAPRTGRKLKIGFVSGELGQHPVAEFLQPILENLDRSRFRIFLYPTVARPEPRAAIFKTLCEEYKPLSDIPDRDAADLIRYDQIDILIDTTSHMKNCRLGIFAHRAAPVQCHYIGYHGSTGLTEMDWLIADNELLPPGYEINFREKIWRLPRLRLAYKGNTSLSESRWEPSVDGTLWLGSFNNLTKVREEALLLWAKVMNVLPGSKLLLKDRLAKDQAVRKRITDILDQQGISPDRVEFIEAVSDWASHMALYDRLDIALDTIPLNSETTAFDALWMGVPLVSLEGNWYGARMSSAILKAFGKQEWIAHDDDEYVQIVCKLAQNVADRKILRAKQRAEMMNSALCDTKNLTKALESSLEAMFDQWINTARPSGNSDH